MMHLGPAAGRFRITGRENGPCKTEPRSPSTSVITEAKRCLSAAESFSNVCCRPVEPP